MPITDEFSTPIQVADRNDYDGTVGHTISPVASVTVSQLGRYFVGSVANHIVRIWQDGVAGAPIVSGTILAASSADANGYKWVSIAPVILVAGVNYHVVGEEASGGDAWANLYTINTRISAAFTYITRRFGTSNVYPVSSAGAGDTQGYNSATFRYSVGAGGLRSYPRGVNRGTNRGIA